MGWIICLNIAVKESLGFMCQSSRVKIGSATRQKDEGRCVCHFIKVLTKNTFCESLWGIEPQNFGSTLCSTLQRQKGSGNFFLTVWGFQLKFFLFLRQLSCAFFFYMLELLPLYYSLRSRTVPRTQLQNVKTSLVWETPEYVLFCHLFQSVFHQDRAQLWHFYWNHVTLVRSYQYLVGQFSEFLFIKITFRILSEMDSLDSLSNFFSFPKNMTSYPFWRQGMSPCER